MTRTQITELLFVGGYPDVHDVADVDVVVNLCGSTPFLRPALQYIVWQFEDGERLPDVTQLELVCQYLATMLVRGYRVLVHCGAGINRGPLVAARTLMYLDGQAGNAQRAIELLRAKRGVHVLSNKVFFEWLMTRELADATPPTLSENGPDTSSLFGRNLQ